MLGEMVPANKTKDMEQNKSARSELLQIGARAVYHVLRLQGALHDACMMHRGLDVTICIRRDSTNKTVRSRRSGADSAAIKVIHLACIVHRRIPWAWLWLLQLHCLAT